jgi:hypothetical protein
VGRTVFEDVEDDTDSYKDMVRTNLDCPCTLPGAVITTSAGTPGDRTEDLTHLKYGIDWPAASCQDSSGSCHVQVIFRCSFVVLSGLLDSYYGTSHPSVQIRVQKIQ